MTPSRRSTGRLTCFLSPSQSVRSRGYRSHWSGTSVAPVDTDLMAARYVDMLAHESPFCLRCAKKSMSPYARPSEVIGKMTSFRWRANARRSHTHHW
eukprot:1675724-Rhodomonas_salina.1